MLKRLVDLAISVSVLLIAWPFLLFIAMLIKFESKGPVLFVQDRIGRNGSIFQMYKFRTMVRDAERMGTGLCSYSDDPRVTRVGRYLRKMSFDELPQLFNVLSGTMSIVGPRPPVTYELGNWADFTDQMKVRFRVKPGITGLAQISGRNSLGWPEKILLDNEYVARFERFGVLVDIAIIVRTIGVIVSMKNVVEQAPMEER